MAERSGTTLEKLVASARAGLAGDMPMPDVVALAGRARSRLRRRRAATVGLAALSVALVLAVGRGALQTPPVTFVLEGAAFADSGFVRTAPAQRATLSFSDDSRVSLHEDTQAHVTERRPSGATVRVASGRVDVSVVHRQATRWNVEPGPFVVHVTGTRFSAAWNPSTDEATVELEEGSVSIEGPGLLTPVVLRPGQRFRGSVRPGAVGYEVQSTSPAAVARPDVAPHVEWPAAVPAILDAGVPRVGRAVVAPPVRNDWKGWSAAGDFEQLLRDAEREGLDGVLERRPVADLLLLGDAARYLSNGVVAQRAFEAAHVRGRGTPAAAVSSFRLGQLVEPVDEAKADAWYQRCLSEDAEGPLAAEALGRRMLLARHRSAPDARALALEYLRRFPTGGASGVARELVR